jgi:sugar phosphate permease
MADASSSTVPGLALENPILRSWQLRTFWLLWGAYASYYLCRVNFAVAQPLILKEFPTWTNAQIGTIPSTYAIFYAAGQIINGTVGQRYGARHMMTLALLIASGTNVLFSFASSFSTMLIAWAINGFAQSAGWSLVMQTVANWNRSERRGTIVGLISTCYTVGNVLSWLLAGFICDAMGWRAAFMAPSLILLPMAAAFYLFLRNSPEDAGLPPVRDDHFGAEPAPSEKEATSREKEAGWLSTWSIVKLTLENRVLWILAIGFFCMNSVRYTFMNWSVQYMADYQGRSIKNSALTAIAIPLIGSLGAITAGWASDNLFGRRRAPVCAIMLLGLACTCSAFTLLPQGRWQLATVILGVAGFMIYGPDMLASGAATIDISHPKAASIATGLTMCFGATGAIFSGAGVGWLKDHAKGNWSLVFWVLAGLSLVSASLMVSIWNARPKGSK